MAPRLHACPPPSAVGHWVPTEWKRTSVGSHRLSDPEIWQSERGHAVSWQDCPALGPLPPGFNQLVSSSPAPAVSNSSPNLF